MPEFAIGDAVQVTGRIMKGSVGTVVSKDEKRKKYLVLISNVLQNYYAMHELKKFTAWPTGELGAAENHRVGVSRSSVTQLIQRS
jgi:hypothetical protein